MTINVLKSLNQTESAKHAETLQSATDTNTHCYYQSTNGQNKYLAKDDSRTVFAKGREHFEMKD